MSSLWHWPAAVATAPLPFSTSQPSVGIASCEEPRRHQLSKQQGSVFSLPCESCPCILKWLGPAILGCYVVALRIAPAHWARLLSTFCYVGQH